MNTMMLERMKKKVLEEKYIPTDLIVNLNTAKEIKKWPEFTQLSDLRHRKKPIGRVLNLNVWINEKVTDNEAYVIDANVVFIQDFFGNKIKLGAASIIRGIA